MQLRKHCIIGLYKVLSHHHQFVGVIYHQEPIDVSASPRRYQVLFSKPRVRYETFTCGIANHCKTTDRDSHGHNGTRVCTGISLYYSTATWPSTL